MRALRSEAARAVWVLIDGVKRRGSTIATSAMLARGAGRR